MTRTTASPWQPSRLLALTITLALTDPAVALEAKRQRELTTLVRQDCGSCHGMTLKGGLGKALLPQSIEHLEVDGLAAIILEGVPGVPMPPWRGLLNEAEARWIARKLKEGFPQ